MCGIAGFSKPEGSGVNARDLAHRLLASIESRGSHAAGFAYVGADGTMGIYKNPKPGSQLNLGELPRDAMAVIMHTRYATQGSPKDNRNNHPVLSVDRSLALVHNGVISNDYALRDELGLSKEHGEVDSLVIPSLIAQQGVESLTKLSGYASIAWLSQDTGRLMHIARLKSSPVSYTQLYDGTFVMASTTPLLDDALDKGDYLYGGIFELGEGRYITVQDGIILTHDASPRMSYSHAAWSRHSQATSGGPGKAAAPKVTTVPPATRGTEDGPKSSEEYLADLDEWRAKAAERDTAIAQKALAGTPAALDDTLDDDMWGDYYSDLEGDYGYGLPIGAGGGYTEEQFEAIIERMEAAEAAEAAEDHAACTLAGRFGATEGFYILDLEGDVMHFPELEDLEGRLAWLSKMTSTEYDMFSEPGEGMNWINHIMDLGHVESDGTLVSWIDDIAEVDDFESPAVRNLQYVREGAGRLATMKGA